MEGEGQEPKNIVASKIREWLSVYSQEENGASILQPHGIEFCQHLNEQESGLSSRTKRKDYKPKDTDFSLVRPILDFGLQNCTIKTLHCVKPPICDHFYSSSRKTNISHNYILE